LTTPHLPILRAGRAYRSLDVATLRDVRDGSPVAEVSQANRGLVVRDLLAIADAQRALAARPVDELLAACERAADLLATAELPLGEDATQTPDEYVAQVSATTGMPRSLARANLGKLERALRAQRRIVAGLTRGLDLAVLDRGHGTLGAGGDGGQTVAYQHTSPALGAVLPNNSPGVHALWFPAIPLKTALVLRPGSQEPWTPYRVAQALAAAGVPGAAVSLYPGDHAVGIDILLRCGRSLVFGDDSTVGRWRRDPRVQIHGAGRSKVLLAADAAARFEDHLDLVVSSIAANGGRSCLNASAVWTAGRGRELAAALADRLAGIEALSLDHPDAQLAGFPNPAVARAISALIDRQLAAGGAVDLTRERRGGDRVVTVEGITYLLPTVVWCEDPEHPLADTEFLFPYAAVTELPEREILDRLGPTLVATALGGDAGWRGALLSHPRIDRLNLGPVPTWQVDHSQPHEGNLFELLYRRRSLSLAGAA
jgi:acyl-CoA reductase-like NAD-dependent aldehyde dehydrogenase